MHDRILRLLDKLALLGIIAALAAAPILAADRAKGGRNSIEQSARQARVDRNTASAVDEGGAPSDTAGSAWNALPAIGFAIWRGTPPLSRSCRGHPHHDSRFTPMRDRNQAVGVPSCNPEQSP